MSNPVLGKSSERAGDGRHCFDLLAECRALEGVAVVRDIRGLGLMIAIELRTKVAPVLKSLMLNHGVIALPAGPTVLRLLPPLVLHPREGGKHTAEAEAVLRGEAALRWL